MDDLLSAIRHSFRCPVPYVRRKIPPLNQGITVLCACAGYGKTAVMHQLSQDYPESVCISFGYEDNDPARILSLFDEAMQGIHIPTGSEKPYLSASTIAEALSEHSGSLVLLDNMEHITSSQACSLLSLFCEAAEKGAFGMVVSGRTIPSFLLRHVMENRAVLWGPDKLRFDPEETAALADLSGGDKSSDYIRKLHSFTGGWCEAVSVLLRSENRRDLIRAAESSLLPEYLQKNICEALDSQLCRRLLQSAFLNGDDGFYQEGLGIPDMASSLARLFHLGIALQNGGEPLYPEVMGRLLSGFLSEEERAALTERAANYYIRNKRFAEAIRLFENNENSEAAERILRLYGSRLLANCEFELIGYCGRIIGDPRKISSPEALGALAQYNYYTGDLESMELLFNLADSMFGKENEYSVMRRFYNGLLRYEKNPGLYAENIRSALGWMKDRQISLPFLYRRELDILGKITAKKEENESRLIIKRFGTLRLMAGKDHTEIQCKTKRSAELLVYLIDHGGRPVEREELLHAIWTEEMPANAVAMLHNMIYHLRRELAPYHLENTIIYKNKTYYPDMELITDGDKEIFDICTLASSGDTDSLTKHYDRLKDYWGAYLGTADCPWTNERREYYDRCYITACTLLSQKLRTEGRTEDSARLLRNAYRLDPYSEQLVSELIDCYASSGKPDKARLVYEEYSAMLDAEFGSRPSKWLKNRYFTCLSDK